MKWLDLRQDPQIQDAGGGEDEDGGLNALLSQLGEACFTNDRNTQRLAWDKFLVSLRQLLILFVLFI